METLGIAKLTTATDSGIGESRDVVEIFKVERQKVNEDGEVRPCLFQYHGQGYSFLETLDEDYTEDEVLSIARDYLSDRFVKGDEFISRQ